MSKIFKITLNETNKNGDNMFSNFESNANTVAELYHRLLEDRIIIGNHLVTGATDANRCKTIEGRRERIIGIGNVVMIELATVGFVENGEVVT